jgi:Xaa-Pro aminopeptidase
MRKPLENMQVFAERRARVAKELGDSVLICSSPEEYIRNGSVHFPFRQDSNLYYLTGFEEPETIFVFRPGKSPSTVLFVRKKDATRETWDGFRFGPEAAQEMFNMDAVYPIEEFDKHIVGLLKGADSLYYRHYKNREMDKKIEQTLQDLRVNQGRTGFGLLTVHDADQFLGEFRVIKGHADLENHRQACLLSSEAHTETMKFVRPGRNEREVQGFFNYQIMKRGAAREGYGSIVASGANACTLHYVFNDEPCKDGDLLLIDAAGEFNYFTSDITRTYPVNGKFTDAQAEVYEGVLKIQKAIIDVVRPGVPFMDLHQMAAEQLTELMLELGLFTGRRDDLIQANKHRKYYPHGVGHFLGMDVHDLGLYLDRKTQEPRKIEAGMVFTVEPGLYIPAGDTDAEAKYRGIGVRIEDNILVTQTGHENMTKTCPKEVADLEKLIGKGSSL